MTKTRIPMKLNCGRPCFPCENTPHLRLILFISPRFPRLTMSTALQDSHVYVCKHSVLDLLIEKPHFSSLREEFLPWLCKLQYRHPVPIRPKIGILIHDKPDVAMRINTLQKFYEINKRVSNFFCLFSVHTPSKIEKFPDARWNNIQLTSRCQRSLLNRSEDTDLH